MFNPEHAIQEWRKRMVAAGVKSPRLLDELEAHLRDDIETQVSDGVEEGHAFERAVARLGAPTAIQREFAKSKARQGSRTLVRILCYATAAAILLINGWTLAQFELSWLERLAGISVTVVVALYLASLPSLSGWLSRKTQQWPAGAKSVGRGFSRLIKVTGVLLLGIPLLMLLYAARVIHFEISIVLGMTAGLLWIAVIFSPFASLFGDGGGDSNRGGPGESFSPFFPSGPLWPPAFGVKISVPESSEFAPAAKLSLEVAREEAMRLGHDYIGTEHVLLGVLQLMGGSKVLSRERVDPDAIRIEIERLVAAQPAKASEEALPLTPRACRALRLAGKEAKAQRDRSITPEHILVGLLREGSGVAAIALKNLGIRIEGIRKIA